MTSRAKIMAAIARHPKGTVAVYDAKGSQAEAVSCEAFGALETPPTVPIERQIACVERELKLRRRVYARQIATGEMTKEFGADEIAAMFAVLETLKAIDAKTRLI